MKRMQLVSQGTLSRMHHEAKMAWERRDLFQCIEILERLSRLSPADQNVLTRLGWIHGLLYNYASAEKNFQRAVQLAPPNKKADTFAQAGQMACDFSSSEIAEHYLSQAVME